MPCNITVKITDDTRDKLDKIKIHKRETYDDIINRIIDIVESEHGKD